MGDRTGSRTAVAGLTAAARRKRRISRRSVASRATASTQPTDATTRKTSVRVIESESRSTR
jgi:hypothetical protein